MSHEALRLCKGDVDEATIVLSQAILEIETRRDQPERAARGFKQLSEQFQQAFLNQCRLVQIRALEVELASAVTEEDRNRIRANIARLLPQSETHLRIRDGIRRETRERHLTALMQQLHTAQTSEERQQIVRRIEELDNLGSGEPAELNA